MAIEIPFLIFHLSVLLFIAGEILKRNAVFSTSFFLMYCIQSVADIVYYLANLIFLRLLRIGLLPLWLGESPIRNYLTVATNFLAIYQYVSHTSIALNRYRTIVSSSNAARSLRFERSLIAMLVLLFTISLPPAILRLTYPFIVATDSQGYYMVISSKKNLTYSIANFLSFLYCVTTCILSLFVELRTVFVYRKLSASLKTQLRSDFRLLLYALLQFVGQFLMAIYSTLTILSAVTADGRYVSWAQAYYPYIVDILRLSGPVCLMITSKALRTKYLNFCGLVRKDVTSVTPCS